MMAAAGASAPMVAHPRETPAFRACRDGFAARVQFRGASAS